MTPLLTAETCRQLAKARTAGLTELECSLDLRRSLSKVNLTESYWESDGARFSYLDRCKERTVYAWMDGGFQPISRYRHSLIKLVPTSWGPPTFEIDGIKMLPSAERSPYADAEHKVKKLKTQGRTVLDCCGGLGYFAAWCLNEGAAAIHSFEKNPDVIWLRSLNPWSPAPDARLTLREADVALAIETIPGHSYDVVLHDPPRFAIAGELYSERFYRQLARVIKPRGMLFHYTGAPNKIARGRDLAAEVMRRLSAAGFDAKKDGDGLMARRAAILTA
jgi:predicted methyltransferase